ncbi:hypothetical protein AWC38_SpisGene24326 [Stylophora pistillata]|uniref:Uncharacterized protein n=1 Tax=Stylophora pistillata TaxID=50429 RepID=A0A2B4R2G5_STYPI|nr:hypothetical protein AWC38_SpisGene24326 [Stylophora pistillata]
MDWWATPLKTIQYQSECIFKVTAKVGVQWKTGVNRSTWDPQEKKGKVLCQLSDSDHLQHPNDLKLMAVFMYRGTEEKYDNETKSLRSEVERRREKVGSLKVEITKLKEPETDDTISIMSNKVAKLCSENNALKTARRKLMEEMQKFKKVQESSRAKEDSGWRLPEGMLPDVAAFWVHQISYEQDFHQMQGVEAEEDEPVKKPKDLYKKQKRQNPDVSPYIDPPTFVYADFEAMIESDGTHVPILVRAEKGDSDECHTFYGPECTGEFLEFLDTLFYGTVTHPIPKENSRDVICIFHKLKGYDSVFFTSTTLKRTPEI